MTKKLTPTWILGQPRPRELVRVSPGMKRPLAHLKTLEHPEGELRDGEINADKITLTVPKESSMTC